MNILTGVKTDTGTTKDINQDSCLLKVARMQDGRRISLAVICDGMGGLSFGEMASSVFVRRMEKWFYEELPDIFSQKGATAQLDGSSDEDGIWSGVRYSWGNIATDLNREIGKYGSNHGIMLGTTIAAQLIIDTKYIAMWIGDSRIYEVSDTGIKLLTHDHTLVQQLIDKGQITEEEAKSSNNKSILLQCIGASEEVRPDFIMGQVNDNVSYILCSDGLWRELKAEELRGILEDGTDLNENASKMIELAKQRGETDNITVVLINCKAA